MTKVLLVEDDETLLSAYGLALKERGYDVTLAGDGQVALRLIQESTPDLIILDLLMPGLSGIDFLKAYNLPAHPGVKVIVFTNMVSPDTVEKARALGAVETLTKSSYTPDQIVAEVKSVLAS